MRTLSGNQNECLSDLGLDIVSRTKGFKICFLRENNCYSFLYSGCIYIFKMNACKGLLIMVLLENIKV